MAGVYVIIAAAFVAVNVYLVGILTTADVTAFVGIS
jgi:hypothetical protein